MTLRTLAEMRPEDRAQAAARLLDDPLAMGIIDLIEQDAINAMIGAEDDDGRREARDTIITIRAFRNTLRFQLTQEREARHEPKGIV